MGRKVVIVDDSKYLVRQLAEFFTQHMGYTVLATGDNGAEAVELFREFRPDLLTLDITMPGKDGKDALREILTEFPGARILIVSAVNGPAVLECIDRGAKGYIEKPLLFRDEEFVRDFTDTLSEIFDGPGSAT